MQARLGIAVAGDRRASAQAAGPPIRDVLHPRRPGRLVSSSALLLALLAAPVPALASVQAPAEIAGDPVPLAAPVVNSFGIRRDANGDMDCPPGEADVTDTQIDVGTSQIYCVFADITDPDGWASVDYANVTAYYDSGSETSVYNQTPGANRNFMLNYTNLSSSSFAMRWPTGPEVTFLGGVDLAIGGTNHELRWRMRFGAAVRWAPCTLVAPVCGTFPTSSIHSWNATVTVRDSSAAVVARNMEFGTFKLTTLSVTNSPEGSGVPGGPEFRLDVDNPQTVTFGSNAPYRLNVSICDLTTNGICGAATPIIPRQNIRVQGAAPKLNQVFRTAFPPAAGEVILNGTEACFNEFRNGTGTAGATVDWYAQIPLGTLAGTYSSVITYTLAHSLAAGPCVQLPPDPPRFLFSPLVTDLSSTSFRVSWVADRPVAGTLEVSTSSTFASVQCSPADPSPFLPSGAAMITASSACTGPSALSPGATYYWRVRMTDALGRTNYYPIQSPYPSVTTKTSAAIGTGNPAFILGPYRDVDGGESCNATDDRQQYFLTYLNHSGAGPLVSRGAGSNSGCGLGARAGWLVTIASNNLRDDDAAGAPHPLACGESVLLWTVGFNSTLLHENRTTSTLPTGGCPPLPGTVSIAVKTRPNISTGFPQYLTTPIVTDLTATSLRLSWVSDKPVYATLHLSKSSTFSSFYCTQMDASNLLTSGGSLIETAAPSCLISSSTLYYWRAHVMDFEGRVTYYPPAGGPYSSNTTKSNFDPGDANNPTLLAAPFRDVDGSTVCNATDDRQQFFLVYVNHTGAERLGWRSTSAGNAGCAQGSKPNWLTTIPLSNLRNDDASGAPHTCTAGDGTNPTRIWMVGFNNSRLHSNSTGTFTYSCPGGTISRLLRTRVDNTGGPQFMYTPLSSDLTTSAFSVSWVASSAVVGALSLSTSSVFASVWCNAVDGTRFLASGAVLISTSPACTLSSPATYYWRVHMMDSVGRCARYPNLAGSGCTGPAAGYPSNTTKTDATPGAGTNPIVAIGPYRDPDGNNACTQLDERQPFFIAYLNHSGAERLGSRGAGSNVGCGGGAVAGWIITFASDNLRNDDAAGGPHSLAAAETLTFTVRGMHLSVYRAAAFSVTWDGAEDPIVRIVESAPTFLSAGSPDTRRGGDRAEAGDATMSPRAPSADRVSSRWRRTDCAAWI